MVTIVYLSGVILLRLSVGVMNKIVTYKRFSSIIYLTSPWVAGYFAFTTSKYFLFTFCYFLVNSLVFILELYLKNKKDMDTQQSDIEK